MANICLFSETDFPSTPGRRAHYLYRELANGLKSLGHDVSIVGPNSGYDSTPEYKCFTHLDAFLRWVERGERVDQLVLWTSKPEEQRIAAHLRPHVGSVCFAELGLTHQQRFIHLDPLGTAHQSSLTKVKVQPVAGYTLAKVDPDGPVAVCLQVESDWQFQNNQMFADNFSMLAFLLATWPEERFIVRPHPLQQDVEIPGDRRIKLVRDCSLDEFLVQGKCVVGANSTSLLRAMELGLVTYQLGLGVGHSAGCFVKGPARPADVLSDEEACQKRLDLFGGLMDEMRRREIPAVESEETQAAILRNVCFDWLNTGAAA